MTGALTAVKNVSAHLWAVSIFAGDRTVEICWNCIGRLPAQRLSMDPKSFPIVGISASVGGVEALETLFEGLHSDLAWSRTFQPTTSGTRAVRVTQLQ
jgi:chemotaxis response regulator CheB